jgi:hypothetical protein
MDVMTDHLCTCTTHSGVKKVHYLEVDQLTDLFLTTHIVKTRHVTRSRGRHCGDIELTVYLVNSEGLVPLDIQYKYQWWGVCIIYVVVSGDISPQHFGRCTLSHRNGYLVSSPIPDFRFRLTSVRCDDHVSFTEVKCRSRTTSNPTDEPTHFSVNDFYTNNTEYAQDNFSSDSTDSQFFSVRVPFERTTLIDSHTVTPAPFTFR